MTGIRRRLAATATSALFAAGGLLSGMAVRNLLHHGHTWPWLLAAGLTGWAGGFAALWLPYLAERRRLLGARSVLLRLRGELPQMVADALGRTNREG